MSDNPGNDKGGKDAQADSRPPLSADQLSSLHQTARLDTTLFDLAKNALNERSQLSGESTDKNHIYTELNRIMSLNNYKPANLDGKQNISDADLPRSWNNVVSHQEFKLYDKADKPATPGCPTTDAAREKLRQQIKDETSTVPLLPDEGYNQVWQRMHPGMNPDDVNRDAHRIKHINGDRDVLKVGERLATATEEEREKELERRLAQMPGCPAPESKPPETKPNPGSNPKPGDPNQNPGNKPDAGNQPKPPEKPPEGPDLDAVYRNLQGQHNRAARTQTQDENSQGIIGRAFDSAKNNIGASGEGRSWYDPRRMWSGLFDSDLGSKAVGQKLQLEQGKLNELKQAVAAKDIGKFSAVYKDITGKDFDPKDGIVNPVAGLQIQKAYDQSQHNGVDGITDVGVALAVAATLRSGKVNLAGTMARAMGTGAVVGGVSKAGLMQIDGHYANLGHDLSTGALMGATVPIGELGGAQVSKLVGKRLGMTVTGDLLSARIETLGSGFGTKMISAAAKSGTSGAVFGAVESPGRLAINDLEQGKPIHVGDLAAASVKGGVFGFMGGTVLGAAVDGVSNGFRTLRPGAVKTVKPTIDGVEVPASGGVGLDQAAKILKMDGGDLTKLATEQPYAAVEKAAKLYERTGLNIKKADPLTGDAVLPKPFEEALTTVQNVDLLTEGAATKLSGKVKVVQATDEFLKGNPAAVDEPLSRLVADPNYKEVVRLKAEQHGQQAADAFESQMRQGFEKDLKTNMAVQQIKGEGLNPEGALKSSQPEVEAAYKQKAADFFKDMTDPAQRARLNHLVDDIYGKFNVETLSKSDFETILSGVPAADRELAVALLHESANTSSDVLLKGRMQALKGELDTKIGNYSPDNVYTLTPDSSANLLGYLYRKSNSFSMGMRNIDALANDIKNGHTPSSVVLFDDISTTPMTQATKEMLSKVPKVYVVDVGAFEKAVNVIDVSKGPQAVASKLNGLLEQARQVRASNPGMLSTGVARETLRAGVDDAAKSIGQNVTIIRPGNNLKVSSGIAPDAMAGMSDVDALHSQYNIPKASKEQIADFLTGYAGEERELAARMLADGAVHNSFPVMVRKAVDLHNKLTEVMSQSGMKMSDLLIVSDKDPGGSTHLVSYLFGKANNFSSENFVSTQRLNQMISGGMVKGKAVAYFDDTIYSGSQATNMLNDNVSSLMPFKKVVVASLGAYDKGVNSIKGTHLGSLGKVEVATSGMHEPFYSTNHPFYGQLRAGQQNIVKGIGGSEGFGNVQGSLIWSYMYPDNNLSFFGKKFAGGVLRLPGP